MLYVVLSLAGILVVFLLALFVASFAICYEQLVIETDAQARQALGEATGRPPEVPDAPGNSYLRMASLVGFFSAAPRALVWRALRNVPKCAALLTGVAYLQEQMWMAKWSSWFIRKGYSRDEVRFLLSCIATGIYVPVHLRRSCIRNFTPDNIETVAMARTLPFASADSTSNPVINEFFYRACLMAAIVRRVRLLSPTQTISVAAEAIIRAYRSYVVQYGETPPLSLQKWASDPGSPRHKRLLELGDKVRAELDASYALTPSELYGLREALQSIVIEMSSALGISIEEKDVRTWDDKHECVMLRHLSRILSSHQDRLLGIYEQSNDGGRVLHALTVGTQAIMSSLAILRERCDKASDDPFADFATSAADPDEMVH